MRAKNPDKARAYRKRTYEKKKAAKAAGQAPVVATDLILG